MKADNRNIFAIKAFLREYLDLRKDKDNELGTGRLYPQGS